jgi:23S rRNA pseudouridine1911/1915/1917 synthase
MPVAGDQVYGKLKSAAGLKAPQAKKALSVLKRQALHAWELGFDHPVTGEKMTFKSDPPEDMLKALDILRRGDY